MSPLSLPRLGAAVALCCLAGGACAQTNLSQGLANGGSPLIGDTAGFPITIKVPGVYRLTSDLTVMYGGSAIDVTVDGVTIDLNGFSIIGSARTCSQTQFSWALTCTAPVPANSYGVRGRDSLVVRNGRIQGFEAAVKTTGGGQFDDLILRHNDYGIWQPAGTTPTNSMPGLRITRVLAEFNQNGAMLENGFIQNSEFKGNGNGVLGTYWVTVNASTVYRNTAGIVNAAVRNTSVFDNQTDVLNARAY